MVTITARRPAELRGQPINLGLVNRGDQCFGLDDQQIRFRPVDRLIVEYCAFQPVDHLLGYAVAGVGESGEIGFQPGVGRIIAIERRGGAAKVLRPRRRPRGGALLSLLLSFMFAPL
jgi:hypothetical protein